jgi:8-oxo-dGTP pyrophosphatase MutT (NUDIX family)
MPPARKREAATAAVARIFDSFAALHQHVGAARYKVHKPACDCSKVVKLALAPAYNNGFVLLPETQNSRQKNVYYHCPIQGGMSYADQPVEAEWQLRNVLFPPPSSSASRDDTTQGSFKISCAVCLLIDQPNGFVGIASDRRSVVEYVCHQARLESNHDQADDNNWHHDHAIDSVVVEVSEAWALATARTRNQSLQAKTRLLASLRRESTKLNQTSDVEIGHHLKIMLQLVGDNDATFWFVMVQNSDLGANRVTLDLPGGKRHLGETSLDCAIRETQEETSLHASKAWIVDILQHEQELYNHYFRMQPPASLLDEPKTTTTAPAAVGFNIIDAMAYLKVADDKEVAPTVL